MLSVSGQLFYVIFFVIIPEKTFTILCLIDLVLLFDGRNILLYFSVRMTLLLLVSEKFSIMSSKSVPVSAWHNIGSEFCTGM